MAAVCSYQETGLATRLRNVSGHVMLLTFPHLGRSGRYQDFYLKSAVDDWVKETKNKSAEEKQAAKDALTAKHEVYLSGHFLATFAMVTHILFEQHGKACNTWFLKRQEAINDQKASIIDERRDLYVANVALLNQKSNTTHL